jgi:hypothetical protein
VRKFLPPLTAIFCLGEASGNEIRSRSTVGRQHGEARCRVAPGFRGHASGGYFRSEQIERSDLAADRTCAHARDEKDQGLIH